MLMFSCAYCNSEIETDSFFCDQCGKEILLCETCKLPGRNQWCEEDGGALVAARSMAVAPGEDAPVPAAINAPGKTSPAVSAPGSSGGNAPAATDTDRSGNAHSPADNQVTPPLTARLRLTNNNLGILLDIQPGSILGRTTGPYAASLGSLSAISGKHLSFKHDVQHGWSFTDMGSSNGTKYSKTNIAWQQTPKVVPNTPVTLEDKAYILIANVEFVIQIEGGSSTSTQRL